MSSRGYNETLTVPSNHKDSSGSSLKAFDAHFKTLNNGLLSVARNLSGMHTKVSDLEQATKSANDLKQRVDTMEKVLTSHGKVLADIRGMLSDMAKQHQAPPNTNPQAPPQFMPQAQAAQLQAKAQTLQKSRAQLMAEAQAQRMKATTVKASVSEPQQQTPASQPQLVAPAKAPVSVPETAQDSKNINDAVKELLETVPVKNVRSSNIENQTLDQILASAENAADEDAADTKPTLDPEDDESESEEDAPAQSTPPAQVPNQSTINPKPNDAEESESESDEDKNEKDKSEDEEDEEDEDVEISEEEDEPAKPASKPTPAPVVQPKSVPQKPSAKPAAKAVQAARRIVTQKKK